jgi:GAF domain-containing protein
MTEEEPLAAELAGIFARMGAVLLSQETLDTAMKLVTSLACESIPKTAGAGVTLITAGRAATAVASDPVVARADAIQYDLDEGPCLTACREQVRIRIDDVTQETRWPRWTRAVAPLGIGSALSAPLVAVGDHLGAIKVYADAPHAYEDRDEWLLGRFAEQAAILLANVQSHQDAWRLSEGLKEALRTRDMIGQAKGILMAREGLDEDAAFQLLIRASQRTNAKLRDVARKVVESAAREHR